MSELKAKCEKRIADADRLIEGLKGNHKGSELEEHNGLVGRDQVEHDGWLDFESDECFVEFWRGDGSP